MALDSPRAGTTCVQHPQVPAAQACDGCGYPFCADCLVPLRGRTLCATCKHTALSGSFRSYQVMVPTRAAAPPPTQVVPVSTTALNSPCALHENREAVALCERCGDFLCLLCLTPFEGRSYCLRCFDLLWERGEIGRQKQRVRWYEDPTTALVAALVTWSICFIPFVSALPALGSVIIAALALSRRGKELNNGQKAVAIGSILLAVLGLGVSIYVWVSIFN